MGTAITAAILTGIVVCIVRGMIRDKKNGKSLQCGCDCRHCSGHCGGEQRK
ncbi:FeoB-associated Cys-rich membrane protein [Lachnospiraceae bacterium JLR.KK008]